MLKFAVLIVLVVFLSVGKIQARCCLQRPINCYECDTLKDPIRCRDPFNRSAMPLDHPPTTLCDGCCVKLVKRDRKAPTRVRRTCISQFQVNLFMVDRACMQEKSKMGTLCFCEENLCNGSPKLLLNAVIVSIMAVVNFFSAFL